MSDTIKKLTVTGLQGLSFEHQLGPMTIFVGPNASGKTARLNAVRLLLAGHHSDIGATPKATFGLCSGASMDITAETGKHGTLSRNWGMKKGSVKSTAEPDPFPETPAVLMSASRYLDLSEKERVKYLAGLVDIESTEWTGERVCGEVKGLTLDDPTQEAVKALIEIGTELDRLDMERHDAGQSVQEWLEGLVKAFKDRISETAATVKRLKGFGSAQAQMQAGDEAEPVRNVDADLAKAQENLGRLKAELRQLETAAVEASERRAEKARLKAILDGAVDHTGAIKKCEEEIAALVAAVADLPEAAATRARLDSELTGLRADLVRRLKRWQDRVTVESRLRDAPDSGERIAELKQLIKDRTEELDAYVSRIPALTEALLEPRKLEHGAITGREMLSKRAEELAQEIGRERVSVCQCCGKTGTACRATNARIEQGIAQELRLGEQLEHQRRQRVEAAEKRLAIEEEMKAAKLEDLAVQDRARERDGWAAELGILERAQDARAGLVERLEGLKDAEEPDGGAEKDAKAKLSEAESVEARLRQDQGRLQTVRDHLAAYQRAQAEIETARAKHDAMGDVQAPDAERQKKLFVDALDAAKTVEDLTLAQKRHAAAQQEELRRQQSLADLAAAEAQIKVEQAVALKLAEIQRAMVEAVFGGLLKTVNQLCGPLFKSPVAYHDGELGRWAGPTWVGHDYFSGMEKLLCYAGISAALSQDAPFRVIMLDELGRLTVENRRLLVQTIRGMIEDGLIDQFLGCDVPPQLYIDPASGEAINLDPYAGLDGVEVVNVTESI